MKAYPARALGMLLACGMAIGLCLGQRAQVATNQAVVTSMYNDVHVRHGTAGWTEAKLNEVLKPTDAVKTGADSRAEVGIGRGGCVRMDESSHLLITQLQEGGKTSVKALIGGVWVTIQKALTGGGSFEVEMPSAVASVKGTVFRCDVEEDGESSTYVYDGEVEVAAGQERLKVEPSQWAKVPRNLKIMRQKMNLADDDQRPWVQYNRHRDILPQMGDPRVIVALTEGGTQEGPGSFLASQALAGALRRLGFVGASVSQADATKLTLGADGWLQWREKPDASYCVVGKVAPDAVQRRPDGTFAAQVRGSAALRQFGNPEALATVSATAPGVGPTDRDALAAALRGVGERLGMDLASRVIRAVMAGQQKALRVDFTGANRDQVHALYRMIAGQPKVARAAPFQLPDGRTSLAVVGDLEPGALAAALQGPAGKLNLDVKAVGRTLQVKLKAMSGPPGPRGKLNLRLRPQQPRKPSKPPHPRPGGR